MMTVAVDVRVRPLARIALRVLAHAAVFVGDERAFNWFIRYAGKRAIQVRVGSRGPWRSFDIRSEVRA